MVARLHLGVAARDDHVRVALDRADEHVAGRAQRRQRAALGVRGERQLHHLGAVLDARDVVDLVDPQPVEDLLHRGRARGERRVDADAAEQAPVAGAADAGDDLRHPELLGQQGDEQVAAVVVGNGHDDVSVLDALLLQELDVGAVAPQHQRVRQPLRELLAARLVRLDDRDVRAVVGEGLGDHEAHVPAADDRDVQRATARREPAPDLLHLVRAAEEDDPVAGREHRRSGGDLELVAADAAGEQDAVRQSDLRQRLAEEGVALLQEVLEHRHAAAPEPGAVHGPGDADDVGDLVGQGPLRPEHLVDQQAHGLEGALGLERVYVALPGDEGQRLLRAQALRRQAGEDVHVVVRGAGDERVGPLDARRLEVLGVRARAAHEPDVEVLQRLLPLGVDVEDRHAVLLVQLGRDERPDLAAADDEHVHGGAMLAPSGRGEVADGPSAGAGGRRPGRRRADARPAARRGLRPGTPPGPRAPTARSAPRA